MSSVFMLALTVFCQFEADLLVQSFSTDPEVIEVAIVFLAIISWNFVPSAFIFTCSGLFQAMGNTWPAMLSTATRILTFVVPVIWVSQTPGFEIRDVWFLSVMAVAIQAVISYLLLRREFSRRLAFPVLLRHVHSALPTPAPGFARCRRVHDQTDRTEDSEPT